MQASDPLLAHTRDARLIPHAFATMPSWLWSTDGSRVLWANATGTALLGEPRASRLLDRRFERHHPAAREIVRLAGRLPADGKAQLARLRGLVPWLGSTLTCACSRLRLPGLPPGVLVLAAEPVKPGLPFAERVRRMLRDERAAVAVFAVDGTELWAGEAVRARADEPITADDLGIAPLLREAATAGYATGASVIGAATVERIGATDASVLIATFAEPPQAKLRQQSLPIVAHARAGGLHVEADPATLRRRWSGIF